MERKLFGPYLAAITLTIIFCAGTVSAQVTNTQASTMKSTALPQSDSTDVSLLPIQLTEQRVRALQFFRQTGPQIKPVRHHKRWFYRGTLDRPLTPRDVAFREAVYRLTNTTICINSFVSGS